MAYEHIRQRLTQLLTLGQNVLASRHTPSGYNEPLLDVTTFFEWKAGASSFLQQVFGEGHPHYVDFRKDCRFAIESNALIGQGILRAAMADIEGGYLKSLESMVSADVFNTLLDT